MRVEAFTRRAFIVPVVRAVFCLICAAAVFGCAAAEKAKPFCIVALPDTQLYSQSNPDIFLAQTKWIKDNKEKLSIVFVVHEGDITNNNLEPEWQNADRAMSLLDDVIAYAVVPGNHDMGPGGSAENRDTGLFNKFFPVSRFGHKPWYGGHYGDGIENAHFYFTASDMKFLVIALEFGPRDEVLDWANGVVSQHKDRRVIVLTHCYMYWDDTRVGEGDNHNPHIYGCGGNDGEEMWEKFVRKHQNIFLVLSGHTVDDGLGRLTSTGDHGNKVHQVLANYQMKENGGNGWLRIMKFVPEENKIFVTTYSPWLKEFAADEENQFVLDYEMK